MALASQPHELTPLVWVALGIAVLVGVVNELSDKETVQMLDMAKGKPTARGNRFLVVILCEYCDIDIWLNISKSSLPGC